MTTNFTELGLGKSLLRALENKGYTQPTPIQEQAIPEVLKGSDLLATAQTGTGKTASFALPILQKLSESDNKQGQVKALIVTPTRELAEQINRNIRIYAEDLNIRSAVLVGGVSMHGQKRQLKHRPEIVVATPGRLMDLIKQKLVSIAHVETLVLDEADRMLDMGFIKDVRKIIAKTLKTRQTLLFSATLSKDIIALSSDILRNPKRIEIAPSATIAENLEQSVFFVEQNKKRELLTRVLHKLEGGRVLVFTRTKHRANSLAEELCAEGISADAIHSNKSQGARRKTLAAFDSGKVNVLVATDVVARGIDVKEITHVINFELPEDTESYVHRIGRTARAEQSGTAFSFCDSNEVGMLQAIQKFIKITLDIEEDQPFHSTSIASRSLKPQAIIKGSRGRRGGGQRGRRQSEGSSNGRYNSKKRSGGGGGRSRSGGGNAGSRRAESGAGSNKFGSRRGRKQSTRRARA
ncbi:MAG: DEAD/DEAH box helicase [Bdellovibrionota bacterium]